MDVFSIKTIEDLLKSAEDTTKFLTCKTSKINSCQLDIIWAIVFSITYRKYQPSLQAVIEDLAKRIDLSVLEMQLVVLPQINFTPHFKPLSSKEISQMTDSLLLSLGETPQINKTTKRKTTKRKTTKRKSTRKMTTRKFYKKPKSKPTLSKPSPLQVPCSSSSYELSYTSQSSETLSSLSSALDSDDSLASLSKTTSMSLQPSPIKPFRPFRQKSPSPERVMYIRYKDYYKTKGLVQVWRNLGGSVKPGGHFPLKYDGKTFMMGYVLHGRQTQY